MVDKYYDTKKIDNLKWNVYSGMRLCLEIKYN